MNEEIVAHILILITLLFQAPFLLFLIFLNS
jgi:hypothetical protein